MEKQYQLELNATEICRACLTKNCPLNNLFRNEIVDGDIVSMPMVYSIGTGLTINENDGFPTKICGNCETKIIENYIFKQKCKKSCELLKKILGIKDVENKQIEYRTIDTQTEIIIHNDIGAQTETTKTDDVNTECIDSTDYDIDFIADQSEEFYTIDELTDDRKVKDDRHVIDLNEECTDDEFVCEYEIERIETDSQKEEDSAFVAQAKQFQQERKRRRRAVYKVLPDDVQSAETVVECKLCNKKMESTAFEMHMQEHLEVISLALKAKSFFRCSCCHFLFLSKDGLLNHFENDRLCTQSLKQKDHYLNEDNDVFSEIISKQIEYIQLYSCYRVIDNFFACELCDVACETIDILEKHFNDEHLNDDKVINSLFSKTVNVKHFCNVCNKGFPNLRLAIYHMFFHQNQFHCPFENCFNFYTKFGFLHRHISFEHIMRDKNTTHHCNYCNFESDAFENLKTHRKECAGRKYVCLYCEKSFFLKHTLKIHERTHTNETRFTCKECQKPFSQSNDLRNHMRIHSGERPYICDICGKSFKTQGHRSDHLATHSIENHFLCKICGNKFKSARILRGHQKVHEEKTIVCELCDKRFARPYHLKSHMKTHK